MKDPSQLMRLCAYKYCNRLFVPMSMSHQYCSKMCVVYAGLLASEGLHNESKHGDKSSEQGELHRD